MNTPNRKKAERFLKLLDSTAKAFTFQTFNEGGAELYSPVILQGTLAKHWENLVARNKAGQGIFVTINQTDLKGRRSQNITAVRAVWQEDDDGFKGKFPLDPSLVVESSPNKFHRYWLLNKPSIEALADHAGVMQRLVDGYGSDPNAKDLTRVLRLPGLYHRKGEPHLVTIEDASGDKYSWDAISAEFPPHATTNSPCGRPPTAAIKTVKVVNDVGGILDFDPWEDCRIVTEAVLADLRSALKWIDPDEGGMWAKMGLALKELGESGRTLWAEYSERSDKFKAAEVKFRWSRFKPERINYKAVFTEAEKRGWTNPAAARGEAEMGNATKLEVKKGAKARAAFELIPVEKLRENPEPLPWLVKGVIPADSIGQFFGAPESCKSLLSLWMSACIAAGTDWDGQPIRAEGHVVYLAGEGNHGLPQRLLALEKVHKIEPKNIHFSNMPKSLNEEKQAVEVAEAIMALKLEQVSLIVVDTMHRHMTGDENSSKDFGKLLSMLDELRVKFNCTVLIIHHAGHDNESHGRGSSAQRGAWDFEYSLTKDPDNLITLACVKSKDFQRPADRYYNLAEVVLPWKDEDGAAITSVTLKPTKKKETETHCFGG